MISPPPIGLINEKSTGTVALDFFDENGNPTVPTSATYRIDTVAGASIKANTAFTTTTSNYSLPLTVTDNTIVDSTQKVENRIITVVWQYGASSQGTAEIKYGVINLSNL